MVYKIYYIYKSQPPGLPDLIFTSLATTDVSGVFFDRKTIDNWKYQQRSVVLCLPGLCSQHMWETSASINSLLDSHHQDQEKHRNIFMIRSKPCIEVQYLFFSFWLLMLWNVMNSKRIKLMITWVSWCSSLVRGWSCPWPHSTGPSPAMLLIMRLCQLWAEQRLMSAGKK